MTETMKGRGQGGEGEPGPSPPLHRLRQLLLLHRSARSVLSALAAGVRAGRLGRFSGQGFSKLFSPGGNSDINGSNGGGGGGCGWQTLPLPPPRPPCAPPGSSAQGPRPCPSSPAGARAGSDVPAGYKGGGLRGAEPGAADSGNLGWHLSGPPIRDVVARTWSRMPILKIWEAAWGPLALSNLSSLSLASPTPWRSHAREAPWFAPLGFADWSVPAEGTSSSLILIVVPSLSLPHRSRCSPSPPRCPPGS